MKRISTLGPSVLLAILAGISYFLITDIDTKDFTRNFTSLNMPYEMTQSFYKRTRFSDEKMNMNRPPFIKVKDINKGIDALQLSIAKTETPVKEISVPHSLVMDLSPYVNAGNDLKSSQEYSFTRTPAPPTMLQEIPTTEFSFSYNTAFENRLDEINSRYDEMMDDLSEQYEACLDQVKNNSTAYSQIKNMYKLQLANLKQEHKKAISEYKKIAKDQNSNKKVEIKKDIKGCTMTVEVLKTSVNQKTTSNPNVKPNVNGASNVSKSKATKKQISDDIEEENYPQ